MNCIKLKDLIYEDDDASLLDQIQMSFHAFFCSSCAKEIERYREARFILKESFFSCSPDLENAVMLKVEAEEEAESPYSIPGILSTRGWVITGLIILVSLVTVFFAFDFQNLARESGMSFLLPIGITVGIVLTSYGALFIGSHLKELSERFGL